MKNETAVMETHTETTITEQHQRKARVPVIPSPSSEMTGSKPLSLKFHVGKDYISLFEFKKGKNTVFLYHLYPLLSEWVGRTIPDGVNPRSHDPKCLQSPVAKQIEHTIVEMPEDFYLANRGITIIADGIEIDKNGNAVLTITDPENQGIADGATTDAVMAKVQTRLAREFLEKNDALYGQLEKTPESLQTGRVHLEVIVGLEDRERIANLIKGRNTSRQVKGWSLADFKGTFDWLKEVLESDNSPVKDRVGYEENSSKDISVLEILSTITLFHPEFDEQENEIDRAPTIAYSNKGRINARLEDPKLVEGYQSISPIILDILSLHDHLYSGFERAYDSVFGPKARLGRRDGFESRLLGNPYELSFTKTKSNYVIPMGFIFPLLASFRALIVHKGTKTQWKTNPIEFFDRHGKKLVAELVAQMESQGGNPNVIGKSRDVYVALYKTAQICIARNEK